MSQIQREFEEFSSEISTLIIHFSRPHKVEKKTLSKTTENRRPANGPVFPMNPVPSKTHANSFSKAAPQFKCEHLLSCAVLTQPYPLYNVPTHFIFLHRQLLRLHEFQAVCSKGIVCFLTRDGFVASC
jgi:hypothetical protein